MRTSIYHTLLGPLPSRSPSGCRARYVSTYQSRVLTLVVGYVARPRSGSRRLTQFYMNPKDTCEFAVCHSSLR